MMTVPTPQSQIHPRFVGWKGESPPGNFSQLWPTLWLKEDKTKLVIVIEGGALHGNTN